MSMTRRIRAFVLGTWVLIGAMAGAVGAAEIAVDLELVLAIDISGSIDPDEAKLQRDGYVGALTSLAVLQAIRSGGNRRIAVAYFEWASYHHKRLVADWALVEDEASAHAFAAKLAEVPIAIGQRTSISGAIEFAIPMFDDNGFEGARRVIDISGDGPNNDGPLITIAREAAIAKGITINGLPVINNRPNRFGFPTSPDLDLYYLGCVIGGSGAFVVVADDFASFAQAIRRKLIMEIAGTAPGPHPRRRQGFAGAQPTRLALWPAATVAPTMNAPRSLGLLPVAAPHYAPGCDIGERQSREFMQRRFWGND